MILIAAFLADSEWEYYQVTKHKSCLDCSDNFIPDAIADSTAYQRLCVEYDSANVNGHQTGILLNFSIVRGNKFQSPQANYMVYRILTDFYRVNGIEMDENTKKMIMRYLQKGAELGDERCLSVLKRIDEMD